MRVSVDCWGTILKGSPTFHQKKIELVKRYFPNIHNDHIARCFESTKKTFNDVIENSGGSQPTIDSIFQYLLSNINDGYREFDFKNDLINEYQQLAIRNSPILYSKETLECIKNIYKKCSLIISSNTMLIGGSTLELCLERIGIAKYIDGFRFSDQTRVAKPNKYMYGGSTYHIGDNPLTDGIGAYNAGSKSIIINSTDLTIKDAYDIILQGR